MEEYRLFALICLCLVRKISIDNYLSILGKLSPAFRLLSKEFVDYIRQQPIEYPSDFARHFKSFYADICVVQEIRMKDVVKELSTQLKEHKKLSDSNIKDAMRKELVNYAYNLIPQVSYDNEKNETSKLTGIKLIEDYAQMIHKLNNEDEDAIQNRLNIGSPDKVERFETALAIRAKEQSFNIKTRMPSLDKYLQGGLKNARIGLIFALPKRFKTTIVLNFACRAFLQGYNVVFVSLEMNVEDAKAKISQIKPLSTLWKTAEKKGYDNFFEVVYRAPHSFSPTDLERLIAELIGEYGKRPNLVIIDYVDIMRNPKEMGKNTEKRHVLNSLYYKLRSIVNKYNIALWTISQANRQATQTQKTQTQHIAEDFSKVAGVDYLISLSQHQNHRKNGFITMSFLESRWTDFSSMQADDILLFRENNSLIFKELTKEAEEKLLQQKVKQEREKAKPKSKKEQQEDNQKHLIELQKKQREE